MATTPDLYYQQVVDNLALTASSPRSLPFFGLPTQGTNSNTRQLNASYTPVWDFITGGVFAGRYLFDQQSAGLGGSVENAQAFQLQPLFDPDKLILLNTALRLAAGDRSLTEREIERLTRFYMARPDPLSLNAIYYGAITHRSLAQERQRFASLIELERQIASLQSYRNERLGQKATGEVSLRDAMSRLEAVKNELAETEAKKTQLKDEGGDENKAIDAKIALLKKLPLQQNLWVKFGSGSAPRA